MQQPGCFATPGTNYVGRCISVLCGSITSSTATTWIMRQAVKRNWDDTGLSSFRIARQLRERIAGQSSPLTNSNSGCRNIFARRGQSTPINIPRNHRLRSFGHPAGCHVPARCSSGSAGVQDDHDTSISFCVFVACNRVRWRLSTSPKRLCVWTLRS